MKTIRLMKLIFMLNFKNLTLACIFYIGEL